MLGSMNPGIADYSERAGSEQAAQIAIALLTDAAELLRTTARILLRGRSSPSVLTDARIHVSARELKIWSLLFRLACGIDHAH